MKRVVVPEILDHLSHDDPEAIRSRADLRRINCLMGNHRWIRRQLKHFSGSSLLELGAGDGELLASLDTSMRAGLDFAPRPPGLPSTVEWISGDIFETLPALFENRSGGNTAIIANLFLHHFESDALASLGRLIQAAGFLCFSEPYRSRLALAEGAFLTPFVNRVTRHDMPVSIRAGFRPGELPDLLKLDRARWDVRETVSGLGACRLLASRKS